MDYNRLQKVFRWNIIANKHQIERDTIGFISIFFIIVFLSSSGNWIHSENYTLTTAAGFMLFGSTIWLIYKASQVCFNMKTKTDFINYGMLPATKSEKFLANIAMQTFVVLAQIIVAVVAVDIVQFILGFITSHNTESLALCFLSHIANSSFMSISNIADGLFVVIMNHATYVLGGAFFRRHQFLYTTILVITIPMVLGTVIGIGFAGLMYGIYEAGYEVSVEWLVGPTVGRIISDIIILLIAALFYYLAYRYFCRNQVINNKVFN